ncbi:MAG: CHAD domain-containing protein [Bryobacterales bacterium]|nr:CHAD domain-containing protein [Bryobacterales bacterium]
MKNYVRQQTDLKIDRVLAELDRTREQPNEEAIHDLRVSIRRLAQALRLFGELLGAKRARKLRNRLRPVLKAAGEARNRDVALLILGEAQVPDTQDVAAAIEAERKRYVGTLLTLVRALEGIELHVEWKIPKSGELWDPELTPAENARAVLPKLTRKFLKAGECAIDPSTTWTGLHQFRLRGKRFRYTLELFEPLYSKGLAQRLASMRKVQTVLGDINDYETMLAMPAVKKHRALVEWLNAHRDDKRSKFVALWKKEFATPVAGKRWVEYLKRYAR